MKEIQLTQGQVALVDDEDFERVSQFKWCASARTTYAQNHSFAAMSRIDGKGIYLHQFILGKRDGLVIDHVNGNPLDCRQLNLRHVTRSQNARKQSVTVNRRNTSGMRGVYWHRNALKWTVQIQVNGWRRQIGLFTDKLEAAKAYNEAAKKYHGEFATLNPIEGE